MNKIFSAPPTVQLEITDVCNERCRHCYNFWRKENSRQTLLTKDKFDRLVDMFVEAGVFHVILTGGEPFTHFELLKYGFKKLLDNNISISCNANLTLSTQDQLHQLRDIGLDHILTSLNSFDPATNDYIVNYKGAFDKIVRGIQMAVADGIRISANMIVSQANKDHVYQTGLLAHELGCQRIFGTRLVPTVYERNPNESEFHITRDDALSTLDQLLRANQETGISIGTLVSYPLCLLRDLDKYRDFVGRGCPGQSGQLMSINANGDTHACVHQEQGYGNVFDIGIRAAYQNMLDWHNGSYYFEGCEGCDYISICQSGCRMSALGYFGAMNERDNLMTKKNDFIKPFKITRDESIYALIDNGFNFTVPKSLRFRKEAGFYLVNIRWANTITCKNDVAELLITHQKSGAPFDLNEFGVENRNMLADLYFKDALECEAVTATREKSLLGLSANIE